MMLAPARIDQSLARSVRRAYFRSLLSEWDRTTAALREAGRRNTFRNRWITSEKQLRAQARVLEKIVSPRLPIAQVRLDARSRGASVVLALLPDPLPASVTATSNASVEAMMLLRPDGFVCKPVNVVVSGHAVDRVIQRCRLMELPIGREDLAAVNAEFADALPLACVAASALRRLCATDGADAAEALNVLLPAPHGVFLASWQAAACRLLVRTFVGRDQLNDAERAALDDLRQIAAGSIESHVLDDILPGWLSLDPQALHTELLDAWRRFGWRFDVDRLHPGLSDLTWSAH